MVTSHVAQKGYEVFSGSHSYPIAETVPAQALVIQKAQVDNNNVLLTYSNLPLLGTLSSKSPSLGHLSAESSEFSLGEQGQDGPKPGRLENSSLLPGTLSAPSFISESLEVDGSSWKCCSSMWGSGLGRLQMQG